MARRSRESGKTFSPAGPLGGWARQGIESFMAAQRILLDLTAGEALLVVDGVKKVVSLPVAAGTMANVARHRVITLIDLQKHLLGAAARQTHKVAESYREGKGLMTGGSSVAELARRGIESFMETEKKFLDLAAHEVTAARAGDKVRKHAPERVKVLTQLAREGGEKYIDAQKRLLNLAVEQMESVGKSTHGRVGPVRNNAHTAWSKLAEKSVHNLVTAQKSLMDLVAKRIKAFPTDKRRKTVRVRARRKVEGAEETEAA